MNQQEQQGQPIEGQDLLDTLTGRQGEIQKELTQQRAIMYDLQKRERELVAEYDTLQQAITRAVKMTSARMAENKPVGTNET